ncbi:nickel pincer cofactor biosynthesis protein LarC [Thalassoporum mexicanum]|uniref:nickel pincer cofactor biosynthesis protein LarC n=1 Tax=Thalassoporum mexicanum TaxID=3457544 RepID=UPI00031A4040|nr:nickel pincer cofactor biosynthesis protein LarC [Pseudanabaena sp. PCC 7367]
MAKIAYFDCAAGIAGDMCLGALVSAGVPIDYLNEIVQRLGLAAEVKIWGEKVLKCGQEATKVYVEITGHGHDDPGTFRHGQDQAAAQVNHKHRHLADIEKIIKAANLSDRTAQWSLSVFRNLANAEAAVHGVTPEQVHFHEVGALDAIGDIVCTCAAIDWLGVNQIYCSALPTGGGYVNCDHGRMPVPAPATLKLWEMHQVPVFSNGINKELVTPTGAAIAVTLCDRFGQPPAMQLTRVGIGAGSRDLDIPNIVRLWLGETNPDSNPINPNTSLEQAKKNLIPPPAETDKPN